MTTPEMTLICKGCFEKLGMKESLSYGRMLPFSCLRCGAIRRADEACYVRLDESERKRIVLDGAIEHATDRSAAEQCVACILQADGDGPAAAVIVVLSLLEGGHELEDLIRELCFYHRRALQSGQRAAADYWLNHRTE